MQGKGLYMRLGSHAKHAAWLTAQLNKCDQLLSLDLPDETRQLVAHLRKEFLETREGYSEELYCCDQLS